MSISVDWSTQLLRIPLLPRDALEKGDLGTLVMTLGMPVDPPGLKWGFLNKAGSTEAEWILAVFGGKMCVNGPI